MSRWEIHEADAGTEIVAHLFDDDEYYDPTGLDVAMVFLEPDNSSQTVTAAVWTDPDDSLAKVRYVTPVDFFLGKAGVWRVRARVGSGAQKWTSSPYSFTVSPAW